MEISRETSLFIKCQLCNIDCSDGLNRVDYRLDGRLPWNICICDICVSKLKLFSNAFHKSVKDAEVEEEKLQTSLFGEE